MSMIDDLKELLRVRSNMDTDDFGEIPTTPDDEDAWKDNAYAFLRDHGQALLDALEKVDRSPSNVDDGLSVAYMVGRLDGQGQASATTLIAYVLDNYEGHAATEESMHIWLSECIDTGRSKTVDGGGV